jgi:hypothetical protein
MSSEERRKILQMVVDEKITAEEAAVLMSALDEPADDLPEDFESERQINITLDLSN